MTSDNRKNLERRVAEAGDRPAGFLYLRLDRAKHPAEPDAADPRQKAGGIAWLKCRKVRFPCRSSS